MTLLSVRGPVSPFESGRGTQGTTQPEPERGTNMSQVEEIVGLLADASNSNGDTAAGLLAAKETADQMKERSAELYGGNSQAVGRAEEASAKINNVLAMVSNAGAEIDAVGELVAAMEDT
jgi:hypothetical protein